MFGFLVLAAFAVPGCQSSETGKPGAPAGGKYRILTTCGMVTDIVRQVAGERAEVVGLMNEGVDPHLYKPTRDDLNQLMAADIVFCVGLQLEGRMTETFARVADDGIPVHAVTDGIDKDELRQPAEFEGHYDPHVWMDVELWSQCVAHTAEVLAEFDPPHADDYRARAAAYRDELRRLHSYALQSMASIPEDQRVLITAHDAFGYFARAYGIDVESLQGITTESEASVDDVNRLVDLIVERKVPALFVESSVNEEGLRALQEGASSRGFEIRLGGELFSDAMGPAGTFEGTYIGMMVHNVSTIAAGLGGTAPPNAFQSQLGQSVDQSAK